MEFGCDHFIKTNDLVRLVDWLNQDIINVDSLWSYISKNIKKCSTFICEHTYFMYFGKVKKSMDIFDDDDMNEIASSLGSTSIYSDGRSGYVKEEYVEVKGYKRPKEFMDLYSEACKYLDEEVVFSSVIQILRYSGNDLPKLLNILSNVINKVEKGKSSLVTNSLVSILGYVEYNKKIKVKELIEYLESIWIKKDKEDPHGVETSSLQVFCTKMITDMLSGEVVPCELYEYNGMKGSNGSSDNDRSIQLYRNKLLDKEFLDVNNNSSDCNKLMDSFNNHVFKYCLDMANLVCKIHENIYKWVCSLTLVHSASSTGPLDNNPLNEAICLYILLESNKSKIPKVYNHKTIGLMLFKLGHLFMFNKNKNKGKINIMDLGFKASDLAIKYLEKSMHNSNKEPLNDYNMFPWQPFGYLTALLNEENENNKKIEVEKVCNIFKKVLELSTFDVKLHILKNIMKSVTTGSGCSMCLMECKNLSLKIIKDEEKEEIHLNFFKYISDCYFRSELFILYEDSIYDSLSILLNWNKFLLMSKNRKNYKEIVKLNYLEIFQNMYNKLDHDLGGYNEEYHSSHINNILLNKRNLIKMLLKDLFLLINKDE